MFSKLILECRSSDSNGLHDSHGLSDCNEQQKECSLLLALTIQLEVEEHFFEQHLMLTDCLAALVLHHEIAMQMNS